MLYLSQVLVAHPRPDGSVWRASDVIVRLGEEDIPGRGLCRALSTANFFLARAHVHF